MTYTLIINDEKITTGNPPSGARRLDTGAWVTPPKDGWTPDLLAACGWFEVTETPRPEPVEGGVHESAVEVVDGLPVRMWTWRAWTAEEIAAQAEAEQQQARYVTHEAILDATAALMADAHTDGQPWVQPTAAHDAYAKGARVSFDGSDYESLIDGNVWSPTGYPAGWRKL